MISKSRILIFAMGAILLATNISTGYMFYSRKSGIISTEKKEIIQLQTQINQLKKERVQITNHIKLMSLKYDSLTQVKNEIKIIHNNLANYVSSIGDSAKNELFIQQLQNITETINN